MLIYLHMQERMKIAMNAKQLWKIHLDFSHPIDEFSPN